MSNIEKIEIHAGRPAKPFKELRRLEVKCEASHAFMSAPTVEEANDRLRALASKIGANGIIETNYDSGISLTSWKSLKASGLAVVFDKDEKICPECAEPIKQAAKICRYCGAPQDAKKPAGHDPMERGITTRASHVNTAQSEAPPIANSVTDNEPLRDNNNSAVWWITGIIAFIMLLSLLGM